MMPKARCHVLSLDSGAEAYEYLPSLMGRASQVSARAQQPRAEILPCHWLAGRESQSAEMEDQLPANKIGLPTATRYPTLVLPGPLTASATLRHQPGPHCCCQSTLCQDYRYWPQLSCTAMEHLGPCCPEGCPSMRRQALAHRHDLAMETWRLPLNTCWM